MTKKRLTVADYNALQADLQTARLENVELRAEASFLRRNLEGAEYVAHWLSQRLGTVQPDQEKLWLHMREAHRLMMEARCLTIVTEQKNAIGMVLFALDDLAATIPLSTSDMLKDDRVQP